MIRPLTEADRPAIETLQEHLTYADPSLVEAAVDGPFVGRLAVDEGMPAGYAIAFPGTTATLSELVVGPSFRRRGCASALVDAVDTAIAADGIAAVTPVENEAARSLYLDLGFEPDERLSEFYADGTDGLRFLRGE